MNTTRTRFRKAFTLVELLIVITIIGIIVGIAAPGAMRSLASTRLGLSGDNVLGRLSQMQQQAISANQRIEVRIYEFDDREDPGSDRRWKALQFFTEVTTGNTSAMEPLSEIIYLDNGMVFHPGSDFSSLIDRLKNEDKYRGTVTSSSTPPFSRAEGGNATYVSFRFLPDGGTDLLQLHDVELGQSGEVDKWFLTIVPEKLVAQNVTSTSDAKLTDFITIQIDPYIGSIRSYRP